MMPTSGVGLLCKNSVSSHLMTGITCTKWTISGLHSKAVHKFSRLTPAPVRPHEMPKTLKPTTVLLPTMKTSFAFFASSNLNFLWLTFLMKPSKSLSPALRACSSLRQPFLLHGVVSAEWFKF